ncbi:MAG: F0F1 ATP synthase subunit gamma [Firmicutes bacterium]|nr:F0F1 ATP synthase subunit gamma [Bacillota bacterium]
MPSLRDIRRRIRSVKNMRQITKAMEMVAAAKLRRAQEKAIAGRPYADRVGEVLEHLLKAEGKIYHPMLEPRPVKQVCYVVFSADRGLCGAYNTNILRKAANEMKTTPPETKNSVVAVGRKARDFFGKRGYNVLGQFVNLGDNPDFEQAMEIARFVVNLYMEEVVDEVHIVYAKFVSALQQVPQSVKILPFEVPEEKRDDKNLIVRTDYIYEPSPERLLSTLLPRFIETQIYRSLLEGKASEQGARMTAMGAATDNAGDMINNLTLSMNKARQAAITKELLDIVGGAEALKK